MLIEYFWIDKYYKVNNEYLFNDFSVCFSDKWTYQFNSTTKEIEKEEHSRKFIGIHDRFEKINNFKALIGKNGAGKSSMYNIIMGILNDDIRDANYVLVARDNDDFLLFTHLRDLKYDSSFRKAHRNEIKQVLISNLFDTNYKYFNNDSVIDLTMKKFIADKFTGTVDLEKNFYYGIGRDIYKELRREDTIKQIKYYFDNEVINSSLLKMINEFYPKEVIPQLIKLTAKELLETCELNTIFDNNIFEQIEWDAVLLKGNDKEILMCSAFLSAIKKYASSFNNISDIETFTSNDSYDVKDISEISENTNINFIIKNFSRFIEYLDSADKYSHDLIMEKVAKVYDNTQNDTLELNHNNRRGKSIKQNREFKNRKLDKLKSVVFSIENNDLDEMSLETLFKILKEFSYKIYSFIALNDDLYKDFLHENYHDEDNTEGVILNSEDYLSKLANVDETILGNEANNIIKKEFVKLFNSSSSLNEHNINLYLNRVSRILQGSTSQLVIYQAIDKTIKNIEDSIDKLVEELDNEYNQQKFSTFVNMNIIRINKIMKYIPDIENAKLRYDLLHCLKRIEKRLHVDSSLSPHEYLKRINSLKKDKESSYYKLIDDINWSYVKKMDNINSNFLLSVDYTTACVS